MIEIFLILGIVILVVALCLHHHSMSKRTENNRKRESHLLEKAAEYSVSASNTVSPLLALVGVVRAVQILESVHARYGTETASDIVGTDTEEMLEILKKQKKSIVNDICKSQPGLNIQHPFKEEALL
jgi:hypothetical protein